VTPTTSSATFPALSGQSRTALFSFAAGIALMFLAGPLVKLVATSDLHSLLSAFADPEVLSAIGVSVLAASWATVAAALAGVPLGFLLARRDFRGKSLVEGLVDLPVVIPHPIAGIALLFVFGRRFFVGHTFALVGVHFAGAAPGIVIAMIFVSAPFLINSSRDGFRAIDPRLENVARRVDKERGRARVLSEDRAGIDLRSPHTRRPRSGATRGCRGSHNRARAVCPPALPQSAPGLARRVSAPSGLHLSLIPRYAAQNPGATRPTLNGNG